MTLLFELDGLPLSYNRHFQIIWGMRETCLSPEAHLFKNRVKMCIPPTKIDNNTPVTVEIEYHSNFKCKNGNNKRIDLQNMDKLLIDAVFEKIGCDDSCIWILNQRKIQDTREYTQVKIDWEDKE